MPDDCREDAESVRIGVDFGVGSTIIAVSGPGPAYQTLEFPGISRKYPGPGGTGTIHAVPSIVGYGSGEVRSGDEVKKRGEEDDPPTARWLRRHLCDRSPVQIPAGDGRRVGYSEASSDFLVPLLARTLRLFPGAGLTFTVPLDAPSEYREFLQRAARAAGAPAASFLDEDKAAVSGYGALPAAGPFCMVSFTEAGLDVRVLLADERTAGQDNEGFRVLAQAVGSVSCRALDTWIAQDLLLKCRLFATDALAVRLLPSIRYEASLVREQVPFTGRKDVRLEDPGSGRILTAVYTPADLDRILADHGVIPAVQDCITRALSAMKSRGGDKSQVRAVFLLGPGCAITAVQDLVRSEFPQATVHADHPLDAVARGAVTGLAPLPAPDRITRSYALRYWDPGTQEHHYRFLVHTGTRYPSAGQVARIVISAAYDGQTHLGIPVYEIGGNLAEAGPRIELVSEAGGGVRIAGPAQDAGAGQAVHANARSPTLLVATPPAQKGEPRFECTFTIDTDRNLCLSARDLVTGTLVKLNAPVHRLK